MKKIIAFLIAIASINSVKAQNSDTLKINASAQTIAIGNKTINSKTTAEELIKILGATSRIEKQLAELIDIIYMII